MRSNIMLLMTAIVFICTFFSKPDNVLAKPDIFIQSYISETSSEQDQKVLKKKEARRRYKRELKKVRNDTERLGDAGRWYIPSLDISVALFDISDKDYDYSQGIVDAEDSAGKCWFHDRIWYIADHWTQGNFINIKDSTVGTKAYLKTGSEIEVYKCVGVTSGINDSYDLITAEGYKVEDSGHDMVLYTCNGNWQNVWIVFFHKIKSVPVANE